MRPRASSFASCRCFGLAQRCVSQRAGLKAIGNVVDAARRCPGTVLASAVWDVAPTIAVAVEAVAEGHFAAADYRRWSLMRHGGSRLVLDPVLVPAEVVEAVEARRADILAGTFTVPLDDAVPAP